MIPVADEIDTLDAAEQAAPEADSPAGDEAPAPPAGHAAPDESSTPPAWQERYENLHRRFGEQGNELGSLRQKLTTQESEIAEFRRFREQIGRTQGRNAAEIEAKLTGFVRDPDRWMEERTAPATKRAEEAEKKIAELEARVMRQHWDATVRDFVRENPTANKYSQDIDQRLRRVPEQYWNRDLLDDAFAAAQFKAGIRAEESARKKAEALTRDAALPKGTGAPSGAALPPRKPGDFGSAMARAKAKLAKGG